LQEQQHGDEQGSHNKHMSNHDVGIQRRSAGDHEMNISGREMNMPHMRTTPRQYYDMMVGYGYVNNAASLGYCTRSSSLLTAVLPH